MDALKDFFLNSATKKPLRDKKMKQGLGRLNPQNLDALLEVGEITQEEYDKLKAQLAEAESEA